MNDITTNLIRACEEQLKNLGSLNPRPLEKFVQALQAVQEHEKSILENPEASAEYLKAAQEIYGRDGELEFDDDAVVSMGCDAGAYVAGWRWVTSVEADLCCEDGCHKGLDDGEGYDGRCRDCNVKFEKEERAKAKEAKNAKTKIRNTAAAKSK